MPARCAQRGRECCRTGSELGDWRDVSQVLATVAARARAPAGIQDRRPRDLPADPRPAAVPRSAAPRRRLQLLARDDEEATPADQLDAILREGPVLGIHLIIWCDTVNNLNRFFTHQILREFEMRVLFQMSPNDSGHMLDCPARQQARPAPGALPQRRTKPSRKIPTLRNPRRKLDCLPRQAARTAFWIRNNNASLRTLTRAPGRPGCSGRVLPLSFPRDPDLTTNALRPGPSTVTPTSESPRCSFPDCGWQSPPLWQTPQTRNSLHADNDMLYYQADRRYLWAARAAPGRACSPRASFASGW